MINANTIFRRFKIEIIIVIYFCPIQMRLDIFPRYHTYLILYYIHERSI